MSDGLEHDGQAQLFAYKQAAGLGGLAAFLIDEGVAGLKDAWTRTDMERPEFEELIKNTSDEGFKMRRIPPEEMRRWIAGAARWAYDNGMRLPKDWIKAASLFGGVGDWRSADVSGFRKVFAGHPEDLRQRLIGEPMETYLNRSDIQFIFSDLAPWTDQTTGQFHGSDDPFDLDDDDLEDVELDDDNLEKMLNHLPDKEIDYLSEILGSLASRVAGETADRLRGQQKTPSPELPEAWLLIIMARMLSIVAMPGGDKDQTNIFAGKLFTKLSERIEPNRDEAFQLAVKQAEEHLTAEPHTMTNIVREHGLNDTADDMVS